METLSAWDINNPLQDGGEFEIYHMSSIRKTTPEFHSHDFYEIYFFISGDVSAYIEEYAYRLKANDVIIFPPGRMHRAFFHNTQAYYERIFIYISRESLRAMGSGDFSLLNIIDDRIAGGQFRHSLSDDNFSLCRCVLEEIISSSYEASPYQRLINHCKIMILLTNLCQWFSESDIEQDTRPKNRMANIIAYINEHIEEDVSLDMLSSKFFISKYHLIREFKNYTNKTVYRYILSKRIIRAKRLMQSGIHPTDVYLRCGFHDYSSFYKMFKKETELSPQQYLTCVKSRPAHTLE